MTPMRQQMIDAMTVRRLAERTQQAYLNAVIGVAEYYHRPPEILSAEELEAVFAAVASNLKHWTLLLTTYSAGLRVSEVTHLRVRDIDSQRMTIRVEQSKGAKDRYTLLSERLLPELRRYGWVYHPQDWLFTGRSDQQPMSTETAQKIYYRAQQKAGLSKRCSIHSLRHAFATHLLEAGVDLYRIQRLMGHSSVRTTMGYFHLAREQLAQTRSPLDLLDGVFPSE